MKITYAKFYDYKSIIKTEIKFQDDITCLIGLTGAGKSSILELLEKIDEMQGFQQQTLPYKSNTEDRFLSNKIDAKNILQLETKFKIEDIDIEKLPEDYKQVKSFRLQRFFDGHWTIKLDDTKEFSQISKIISSELKSINDIFSDINNIFDEYAIKIPEIVQHRKTFDSIIQKFNQSIEDSPEQIDDSLAIFKNSLFAIPHKIYSRSKFINKIGEIEFNIRIISEKLSNNSLQRIYSAISKPEYIKNLSELDDKILLDDYLNDDSTSITFKAIGIICGFDKESLNNIRNDQTLQKNHFEKASEKLTKEFNAIWTQSDYELIIDLNNSELTFSVKDTITGKITKATQRSEGLQWILLLFFKIKSLISSRGLSHILLLDTPATAIHDSGKEEIRKFITKMAERNHLQIIYTTHERALIDPWRLERIRFIKKEKEKGTLIHEVKNSGIDSTRIEISKHIGSPAKYSLFGAPIIIYFEGPSDYKYIAALNEYAKDHGNKSLHSDIYSIDDMGGIDNSKNMMRICKNLKLEFYFVIDGGAKSKKLENELKDDFKKHYIPLTDVIEKDAVDIEDLIDPELFHKLFMQAYDNIHVPSLMDIRGNNTNEKTVTSYITWLKNNNCEKLNKVGIATLLMEFIKSPDSKDNEPLKRTLKNYENLVKLITEKSQQNN